jgi:hypothetical protein
MNIALFIDGTWNKPAVFNAAQNTNVFKLYKSCCPKTQYQNAHYLRGVGSDLTHKLTGGLFGRGMKDLIKQAYAFLSGNYNRGDHLFLFGFSRGAFAVRSLAGFIDKVGLLLQDKPEYLPKAYALYEHRPQHGQLHLRSFLRRVVGAPTPTPEVSDLPIYFIGVWDAVAALGLPGRGSKFSAPFTEYHQTELPSNVTHARHALGLHELRQPFEPLLWMGPSKSGQTLEQVWFPGAHADVGGGYRETQWSNGTLRWMASEAESKGLQVNNQVLPNSIASDGVDIHHAIRRWFVGLEPTVRTVLAERTDLAPAAVNTFSIHPSACRRLLNPGARQYTFWRPGVNEKLQEIDEMSLQLFLEIKFKYTSSSPPSSTKACQAARWWTRARVSDAERANEIVERFIKGAGAPGKKEFDVFVRSLCLKLLCDDKASLNSLLKQIKEIIDTNLEAIRGLIKTHPVFQTQLDTLWSWLGARFAAIIEAVALSASLLPPQWQREADEVCKTMQTERKTLRSALIDLDIQAGIRNDIKCKTLKLRKLSDDRR